MPKPRCLSRRSFLAFRPPPRTLPRPIGELDQWLRACRGLGPSDASFERVAAISETILLGTIALRVEKKLRWDPASRRFPNAPEADALATRTYREGWAL